MTRAILVGVLAFVAVSLVGMANVRRVERWIAPSPPRTGLPQIGRPEAGYAQASRCRSCHPRPFESWHRSFHRTMTQVADEDTVQGRFDGRIAGSDATAFERDGVYWFSVPDPSGGRREQQVVMTTGSHHMQVYWVEGEHGALQSFPWAYLLEWDAWVPNESTLLRPEQAGVVYTWNRVCIKCHAVAGNPGFDASTRTVSSSVVDLGIACEACHGPASEHLERYTSPWARLDARRRDEAQAILRPEELRGHRGSEVCGQCHSISVFHDDDGWVADGPRHVAGDPLEAWGTVVRHPMHADQPQIDVLLEEDSEYLVSRFWSDGMVRVSGREFNGVVESPCWASEQFGCASCHSMHTPRQADDQLRRDLDDDAMCTSCHDERERYGVAHTHHAMGSPGSRCMNCHMPHTTYGLLKAMRSHQIDVPSVDATLQTGRPNACNACHLDRSLAWTARWLQTWYGVAPPLEARASTDPAMVRWLIAGDAGQRALAAWHFGWSPAIEASDGGDDGWMIPLVAELLTDSYPAVRWVAWRTLARWYPDLSVARFQASPHLVQRDVWSRWRAGSQVRERRWPQVVGRLEALRVLRDERPMTLAE